MSIKYLKKTEIYKKNYQIIGHDMSLMMASYRHLLSTKNELSILIKDIEKWLLKKSKK